VQVVEVLEQVAHDELHPVQIPSKISGYKPTVVQLKRQVGEEELYK
jgi:hypothetical protein